MAFIKYDKTMQVHQLKDPVSTSNVYLIDAKSPILIDTGGSLSEEILALVNDVLAGRPVQAIIFTHGHPDHIGDADGIASTLNAPMFIHARDHDKLPQASILGSTVDLGDGQLEVIPTPGHCPGSVSLYERKKRWLFSGDCIFPGGRAGRWDLPGAKPAELAQSVKTLSQLTVDTLYPGHYDVTSKNVSAHLQASVETVRLVGDPWDEAAYDARISSLDGTL